MDGLEPLPNRQVESTRWRTKTNDVLEVSLDPLLPLFGAAWLATRAKENGAAIREWHSHIFISPLPVNFAAIHAEVCQHRRPGGAQGNARVPPRDEVQCPNWSVSDDRIQADYVVTFATNGHGGSRLKYNVGRKPILSETGICQLEVPHERASIDFEFRRRQPGGACWRKASVPSSRRRVSNQAT
jgi:hypothetical protein